jgi:hypothetical protein
MTTPRAELRGASKGDRAVTLSTSQTHDSTDSNLITVDRFQLHRVLDGHEPRPLEWSIYHGSELPAGVIGEYVTAYASDLGDALLDQWVVMGGQVKNQGIWTSGHEDFCLVELVDRIGTFTVRLPEPWVGLGQGEPVLVAGQVDEGWPFGRHLGATGFWTWATARAMGPARFAEASAFPW